MIDLYQSDEFRSHPTAPAQLDERLSLVASFVRQGSRMTDVGTDHAYLPTWLVREGICPSAIATDLRPDPAARAAQTVAASGLESQIAVRLGDGLASVMPEETDDIVIAGMGGETIIGILEAAPWLKNPRYRLVLQPMTKPAILHEYLLCSGFALQKEYIADDGKHLYPVIQAQYNPNTASRQSLRPAAFVRGAVQESDGAQSIAFLNKQKQRLLTIADALFQSGQHGQAEQAKKLAADILQA